MDAMEVDSPSYLRARDRYTQALRHTQRDKNPGVSKPVHVCSGYRSSGVRPPVVEVPLLR